MIIILVRHGETDFNIDNRISGHNNPSLNYLGKKQAVLVGARLKEVKIDYIYSSDLERAIYTALEISKHHKAPLTTTEDIRERYFGDWEGKKRNEVNINNSPENIETWELTYERAKRFLDNLLKKHIDDRVVMVSHGGFGRAFIAAIHGSADYIKGLDPLKNTSVTSYKITKDGYEQYFYNCTKHLD